MTITPDDLATLLRIYFDTEASHAGLRSPDIAREGGRTATTPDAAAVARVGRAAVDHVRIRRALQALSPQHREILTLAFGVTLRNRDVDDTSKRKAIRTSERAWRVQLAELYGVEGAVVLASPKARRMFEDHLRELGDVAAEALPVLEERVAPLLSPEVGFRDGQVAPWEAETAPALLARGRQAVFPSEALPAIDAYEHERAGGLIAWLIGPGKAFRHVIAADAKKVRAVALDAFAEAYGATATPKKRTRDTSKTRARILAFHAEHGQEIG